MKWPFGDIRPFSAEIILADPAWFFALQSPKGETRSPQAHYDCMPLEEIKALPVGDLAHPDGCFLLLWATAPMLPHAIDVMASWHFKYVTAGCWGKLINDGSKPAIGLGYVLRSSAEYFLIGKIGQPLIGDKKSSNLILDDDVLALIQAGECEFENNLILSPRREHSRKPDQIFTLADKLSPYATNKVELFARQKRKGWQSWGNQTELFREET